MIKYFIYVNNKNVETFSKRVFRSSVENFISGFEFNMMSTAMLMVSSNGILVNTTSYDTMNLFSELASFIYVLNESKSVISIIYMVIKDWLRIWKFHSCMI